MKQAAPFAPMRPGQAGTQARKPLSAADAGIELDWQRRFAGLRRGCRRLAVVLGPKTRRAGLLVLGAGFAAASIVALGFALQAVGLMSLGNGASRGALLDERAAGLHAELAALPVEPDVPPAVAFAGPARFEVPLPPLVEAAMPKASDVLTAEASSGDAGVAGDIAAPGQNLAPGRERPGRLASRALMTRSETTHRSWTSTFFGGTN